MRKIDRDAMLEDLDEMKQIDFLELIREAAAEAAGSSPVKVWDVRTQKSTIYRHVAIYVLHQFGFEAKRIGAFLQFQRQTVVEIVRDFQRGLDSFMCCLLSASRSMPFWIRSGHEHAY